MTMPAGMLDKYKNPVFIETGSSIAGCCERALHLGFKEIHGIELDVDRHNQCKKNFGRYKNYHMYCGSSADWLPKILETIQEPATIWLDAHPYNDVLTVNDAPILQELQAILNHSKRIKFTVIIDDITIYREEPDRKQILELAAKIGEVTLIDTQQGKNDIAIIKGF
jgi:hypothetical protein